MEEWIEAELALGRKLALVPELEALSAEHPYRERFGAYFFFQAEDGIRDWSVTGVQTCALPILADGRVLVAGGTGDSGPLSSAEIFDPANPDAGFRVVASAMSATRARHTATLLSNGTVLIAGGEADGDRKSVV